MIYESSFELVYVQCNTCYLSLNLSNHLPQNFNLEPALGSNIELPDPLLLFDVPEILFVKLANVAAAATPNEALVMKSLRVISPFESKLSDFSAT